MVIKKVRAMESEIFAQHPRRLAPAICFDVDDVFCLEKDYKNIQNLDELEN